MEGQNKEQQYDSEGSTAGESSGKRQGDFDVFSRSKKFIRTPIKKSSSNTGGEMEALKDMMKQLLAEVKEIKTGQQIYERDIKMLKEENKILKERVLTLENKISQSEKREKKNNIVVKGVNMNEVLIKNEVETFLKTELDLNITIRAAEVIKPKSAKPFVLVKLNSWQDKVAVMKTKKKLRGTNKYIDDDLTQEEQKMQASLREIAKLEKGKGRDAKVGYGRIFIDRERWDWNQHLGEIVRNGAAAVPKN